MDGKKRKHGYLDGEEEEESAAATSESHTFGDMDSSSDEDGENAPKLVDRQREAAVARMQRYFGLEDPVEPQEPIVQDDSNFLRKMYWTCIQDGGFPHRVNHAVAVHKDDNGDWYTFSFGGYHADDEERSAKQADSHGGPLFGGPLFRSKPIDVHVCDVATRTWSCLDAPPEEKFYNVEPFKRTRVPGCRYGHTVCAYQGRVYMYGGRNDDDGSFSTVDCYDIANNIWVKITCTGDLPSSRDGHACASIGPYMYVYGGFSANDIKFIGETYVFNMETHIWEKLPRKGYYVPERDFHTTTAIEGGRNRNKLVVFGGRSDQFYPYFTANDTYDDQFYSYNLSTYKWKKRKVTGYQASGRRSHCAVNIGCSVLIFGGYNATHKQHFGDLFIVNTESWFVTEIRPFGVNPCPRRRVGCGKVGSEILICGGTSPISVSKDSKEKEILHDHNDVFILHLVPTLQQLCMMSVILNKLSFASLPLIMQNNIEEQLGKKLVTITHAPVLPES